MYSEDLEGTGAGIKVRGVGYELDEHVFKAAEGNLKKAVKYQQQEVNVELINENSMEADVRARLSPPTPDTYVIILVDPPWQSTRWDRDTELSLNETDPKVPDIISHFKEVFPDQVKSRKLLFAIPCPRNTDRGSIVTLFKDKLLLPVCVQEKIPVDTDEVFHTLVAGVAC
eukprot:TRINITY_DN23625_c0_g1_i1.p1 TRINITY_DN23625_c0_g1~~TRINITY_DN23625_c0_g1_i1.p1  ORF type:complete len:191 (+),score=55.88 TRINITY_DN23625_c0_g1_i1:63-575(+)